MVADYYPAQRTNRIFATIMPLVGLSPALAPLLGSWLLQYDFRLVCSAGAALFIACAAFNAWYLPA
ncbi:hypothetical protein JTM21_38625, partial [Pseudomonas aeruginosa]|nr:hypothetical protein [Pseudomonas aeruginosa]